MSKIFNEEDVQKIIEKIVSNGTLSKFLKDVKVYFKMLSDVFSRRYTRVPRGTVAAIVGSLLYVLSPVDLIPDMIPVIGYLDDAAVLALCLKFVKHDVDEYKQVMRIE